MEMAKELSTVHDKAFATRPSLSALKLLGFDYAMFGFAPYGDDWREMRKITTLELLSNHRLDMSNFKQTRASEFRIVVGKRYYGDTANSNEGEARQCQKSIKEYFHLFGTFILSDAIPFLWLLDIGGHKKSVKRVAKELDVFVQTWVDEHKQKRVSAGE
ncbi:Nuclear matrix constituent protein 1-like protein, putative isoform 1 [Hibiscus syriacus]|uniref:Nuclear matrix constituent protein 1-like protein, putative isoform 1 n=1 Tax=Hibiscus syriacus TaxID=106335 RepID=A0A6A2ZW51_HIBSY|nr:Nuclear matrix constituent protein 1-like protein, putative isoform 1 [Hibiscus syriacus]